MCIVPPMPISDQVLIASDARRSSTVIQKPMNARLVIAIKLDLSICNATIWADARASRALAEKNATGDLSFFGWTE